MEWILGTLLLANIHCDGSYVVCVVNEQRIVQVCTTYKQPWPTEWRFTYRLEIDNGESLVILPVTVCREV